MDPGLDPRPAAGGDALGPWDMRSGKLARPPLAARILPSLATVFHLSAEFCRRSGSTPKVTVPPTSPALAPLNSGAPIAAKRFTEEIFSFAQNLQIWRPPSSWARRKPFPGGVNFPGAWIHPVPTNWYMAGAANSFGRLYSVLSVSQHIYFRAI